MLQDAPLAADFCCGTLLRFLRRLAADFFPRTRIWKSFDRVELVLKLHNDLLLRSAGSSVKAKYYPHQDEELNQLSRKADSVLLTKLTA